MSWDMNTVNDIYGFSTDIGFVVGNQSFEDLEIRPIKEGDNFYYFYDKKNRFLIKFFVLDDKKLVQYVCHVTLIKKDNKFTPRLAFSVRNKNGKIVEQLPDSIKDKNIKANVNLDNCHENFWNLISFMQSISQIDVPKGEFSLITQEENEIVQALKGRDVNSIKNIIKQLSSTKGVLLSEEDVNQLLNRKERLLDFEKALKDEDINESWWQDYFESNKWIFGYGLNYEILRQQQTQPNYGGAGVDRSGERKGDFLLSTTGDIGFTVLVEIKTPKTPLIQGGKEIRTGAWSLSKNLTDSITQIQSNIYTWVKQGSENSDNRDKLENENIFTVQPKGIVIIGSLDELDDRNKRETFQRFRKSIHGVDIITFDELLARARYIIKE